LHWLDAPIARCETSCATPAQQPHAKENEQRQHGRLRYSAKQLEWEAEPST